MGLIEELRCQQVQQGLVGQSLADNWPGPPAPAGVAVCSGIPEGGKGEVGREIWSFGVVLVGAYAPGRLAEFGVAISVAS